MLASEATADQFCSSYPIGQAKLATLEAALNGTLSAVDPHSAGFRSLALLDADGRLTDRGRWKMISEIPSAAAQAKLLACDVAVEVSQQGQLMHGGWGYAEEYPISRYVVDALVLPIFEGVKPILELKVVGRSLLA